MNTPYDVAALRRDFPILSDTVYGKPLIYFDNAASRQAPRTVIDEIDRLYLHSKANVHRGVHCLSQKATAAMEASRERVRDFIGAESSDEIIFTRGTTEAINLVASSYGSLLSPGDEIILTQMEHHSNIVPWQLLEKRAGQWCSRHGRFPLAVFRADTPCVGMPCVECSRHRQPRGRDSRLCP